MIPAGTQSAGTLQECLLLPKEQRKITSHSYRYEIRTDKFLSSKFKKINFPLYAADHEGDNKVWRRDQAIRVFKKREGFRVFFGINANWEATPNMKKLPSHFSMDIKNKNEPLIDGREKDLVMIEYIVRNHEVKDVLLYQTRAPVWAVDTEDLPFTEKTLWAGATRGSSLEDCMGRMQAIAGWAAGTWAYNLGLELLYLHTQRGVSFTSHMPPKKKDELMIYTPITKPLRSVVSRWNIYAIKKALRGEYERMDAPRVASALTYNRWRETWNRKQRALAVYLSKNRSDELWNIADTEETLSSKRINMMRSDNKLARTLAILMLRMTPEERNMEKEEAKYKYIDAKREEEILRVQAPKRLVNEYLWNNRYLTRLIKF